MLRKLLRDRRGITQVQVIIILLLITIAVVGIWYLAVSEGPKNSNEAHAQSEGVEYQLTIGHNMTLHGVNFQYSGQDYGYGWKILKINVVTANGFPQLSYKGPVGNVITVSDSENDIKLKTKSLDNNEWVFEDVTPPKPGEW